MAFSLNDVLAAPTDPEELNRHLLNNGLIPPPAPVVPHIASPTVAAMSPVVPHPGVSAMKPPSDLRLTEDIEKTHPTGNFAAPADTAEPSIEPAAGGGSPSLVKPMAPPKLSYKDEMALPQSSPGTPVGSSAFWQNQLERDLAQKEHPWGSAENHPGLLGKIGHIAAKIGNVAGDVVAPGIMAAIPGIDLNKKIGATAAIGELGEAQKRETAEASEKTREKHEENVADVNQQKVDAASDKLEAEWAKIGNQRERDLRKSGLKPNPLDPKGPPVNLSYEEMSPTEQAVHDLKGAQEQAASARAALDGIKADPNSPQSQAALARVRVMAQNASTAAGKLGLDQKKFVADYFGLDDQGNPIPGTQTTPEGKPVGPKIATTNQKALSELNTHYVVPANAVEKSYQMMDNAYNEYKAAQAKGEDLPTGAQSMLALSTHLSTTFGNVKGARITKDMIEHHLHARSVSDGALTAIQRLTNGDVLSPAQWDAFHDLVGQSRKLSWQTAAKEAKRANLPVDFLPDDLNKELGGKGERGAAKTGGEGPPRAPKPGMKWQQSKKTGEYREVPAQ